MHLSCSDAFTDGWGQSGGPDEIDDPDWQIAFFSIARYKQGEFFRGCGNVVNNFMVDNTATATGMDSFPDDDTVSDDASVTVKPGIKIAKIKFAGKHVSADLTNFTDHDKEIADVEVYWPESSGNLTEVRLSDFTFWQGSAPATHAHLFGPWIGTAADRTLEGLVETLRFEFSEPVSDTGYMIRVNFTDTTFLDVSLGFVELVPEPDMMMLLIAGIGGLTLLDKRRRRLAAGSQSDSQVERKAA